MKPRRRLYAANVVEQPSVAILVHGTFAGSDNDRGDKWWQSGSPVAEQLASRLPDSVQIAPEPHVFHWSGENSERARNKAAVALFETVKRFERAGQPYHLVGHSHGGSVIWNMLKLATIRRRSLDLLRTWTTVGTPFLQHRSRDAWNPANIVALIVGLMLLRPVYRTSKHLAILLWNAAIGNRQGMLLTSDGPLRIGNFFDNPVLAFLHWTGIPMTETSDGIQVGCYDPNGTQSLAAYLFLTGEGLFLLTMALAAAYTLLLVGLMCIRPVIESYRLRAENNLEDDAFAKYQPRWLGLWSTDDEAINGLRATLDLSMSFFGKMTPRERVFLSDNLNLLSSPIYWVAAPVFNFVIQPLIDRSIRGIVTKSAQGNDRPTANIIDVSPCPFAASIHVAPPLPSQLTEELVRCADLAACDIAPKLRKLLSLPSFTAGLQSFSNDLAGGELVHTAYFDHDEILDLIACNLAWGTSEHAMRSTMARMQPWLVAWFATTKSNLQIIDSNLFELDMTPLQPARSAA